MILVLGTVKLPSGKLEGARAAMELMIEASRAEPGCIAYSYAQDLLDPETIHVVEQWRDRQALTDHFATPHMAEWRGVMGSLGLTGRDLKLFEADDGRSEARAHPISSSPLRRQGSIPRFPILRVLERRGGIGPCLRKGDVVGKRNSARRRSHSAGCTTPARRTGHRTSRSSSRVSGPLRAIHSQYSTYFGSSAARWRSSVLARHQ
jgi:quinol monooxygenase YgiN